MSGGRGAREASATELVKKRCSHPDTDRDDLRIHPSSNPPEPKVDSDTRLLVAATRRIRIETRRSYGYRRSGDASMCVRWLRPLRESVVGLRSAVRRVQRCAHRCSVWSRVRIFGGRKRPNPVPDTLDPGMIDRTGVRRHRVRRSGFSSTGRCTVPVQLQQNEAHDSKAKIKVAPITLRRQLSEWTVEQKSPVGWTWRPAPSPSRHALAHYWAHPRLGSRPLILAPMSIQRGEETVESAGHRPPSAVS